MVKKTMKWKKTMECVSKNEIFEKPQISQIKNIASIPKPDKSLIIQNQISHFGKKNK